MTKLEWTHGSLVEEVPPLPHCKRPADRKGTVHAGHGIARKETGEQADAKIGQGMPDEIAH